MIPFVNPLAGEMIDDGSMKYGRSIVTRLGDKAKVARGHRTFQQGLDAKRGLEKIEKAVKSKPKRWW